MERVLLDIMGPLNETEHHNIYVLIIQDYFTKWVEAFPVTVTEVLASQWLCRYAAPHSLYNDQGWNIESEVFREMCTLFGIEKTQTTPFRPQSTAKLNGSMLHCSRSWPL